MLAGLQDKDLPEAGRAGGWLEKQRFRGFLPAELGVVQEPKE